MRIYCLFCETGRCDSAVRFAETRYHCRAISPKQVQHTWVKGKMTDLVHDLLPGYVFLYFEGEAPSASEFREMTGFIRCLSDTDGRLELTGEDEAFALSLLEKNGIIGKTEVYQEGDRIRIREGVFEGLSTSILKVDRRCKRMLIEIPLIRQPVRTWVEYEIVEREKTE